MSRIGTVSPPVGAGDQNQELREIHQKMSRKIAQLTKGKIRKKILGFKPNKVVFNETSLFIFEFLRSRKLIEHSFYILNHYFTLSPIQLKVEVNFTINDKAQLGKPALSKFFQSFTNSTQKMKIRKQS